jgi:hypothetical protein
LRGARKRREAARVLLVCAAGNIAPRYAALQIVR